MGYVFNPQEEGRATTKVDMHYNDIAAGREGDTTVTLVGRGVPAP